MLFGDPTSFPRDPVLTVLGGLALVANLVCWAAFRLDKRRARRGSRRISERRLLQLAALGGLGAIVAMYAHRERHKVDKRRFATIVWLLFVAQVALLVTALVLTL